MKLVQFINNRTEELMLAQEVSKSYLITREAESEALKFTMNASRFVIKYVMVLKVLAEYFLVLTHFKEEPSSPIRDKKLAEHNHKLKKIGMKEKHA